MNKKKILYISDFDFKGSGYLNISIPICSNLSNLEYDVKCIGLNYKGEEHRLNFSIIPCNSFQDACAMLNNLKFQWNPDIVIVAMDIPFQEKIAAICNKVEIKMIAITPLENSPLTLSWAYILQQINKVFFISQLGGDEGIKSGVSSSEHLVIGMDTDSWRMRTVEEYNRGREMLNISPETLVILTVADNQERKNLSKAMEIVGKLKKEKGVKVKYILVTRENSGVGWKLRDLAMTYNIASELSIFERGLPFKELYALYAMSDAFLITSKAEGLCMPVMESMSIGVPVVATSCGALPELLGEDRGYLMTTEYSHIDPWGNSLREFPLANSGVEGLLRIKQMRDENDDTYSRNARKYMESRTWEKPVVQLVQSIEELTNEKQ